VPGALLARRHRPDSLGSVEKRNQQRGDPELEHVLLDLVLLIPFLRDGTRDRSSSKNRSAGLQDAAQSGMVWFYACERKTSTTRMGGLDSRFKVSAWPRL
jgi:hypothetical protein